MPKNAKKAEKTQKLCIDIFKFLTAVFAVIISVAITSFYYKISLETKEALQLLQNDTKIVELPTQKTLKYWKVCLATWSEIGNLRSMDRVFEKLGYTFVNATETGEWDILWTFEYVESENEIYKPTKNLLQHHRINHFPGIYYLTCKRTLGMYTTSDYLFPTFTFPQDEEKFSKFAAANPDKKYVEKNSDNRGVRLVSVDEFNRNTEFKIYQVFMDKPFLIDDHAFDFGVYVLISSVDPLRIYRYDHEVLIRFCPQKYHPFDPSINHKYVVDDEYTSAYEMPSFSHFYNSYGYTLKIIFENIIQQKGFDVKKFWQRIDKAVSDVILKNEGRIIETTTFEEFESTRHFFEIVRFDIILDEDLNPHIMEINMSPALTPDSETFYKNALIYEQVVYNTVMLIGGGSYDSFMSRFSNETISANIKNIATNFVKCSKNNCYENCQNPACSVCIPCISSESKFNMIESYREHNRRENFKRVFPGINHYNDRELFEDLTENNQIMMKWFKGKCKTDKSWC